MRAAFVANASTRPAPGSPGGELHIVPDAEELAGEPQAETKTNGPADKRKGGQIEAGTGRRKSANAKTKDARSMTDTVKKTSDATRGTQSGSVPQSGSGLKIVREATAPAPKPDGKGRDRSAVVPVAVDARGVAAMFSISIRTVRRLDSSGKIPLGFKLGSRKLWRLRDLRLWSERGFPCRSEFQEYVRTEARKTGSRT